MRSLSSFSLSLLIALFALLGAASVAWAQPRAGMSQEAKIRYSRGIAHYEAREYEAAIKELSAAYDFDPTREILFAWAQAERLSGDCASAVVLYARFLEADPPKRQARAAEEKRALCEQALATKPEGVPQEEATSPRPAEGPLDSAVPPAVEGTPVPVAALPSAPPAPEGRRGLRIAGIATMIAGAASLGFAIKYGFDAQSYGEQASARAIAAPQWSREVETEIAQLLDQGNAAERNMYILYGASGALVATGAVLVYYGTRDGARAAAVRSRIAVRPQLLPSGAALGIGGRF